MIIFFSHFLSWWSVIMWGVSWCSCDCSSRTGDKTVIIIRAVNIMSVLLKRRAWKLIHLEALCHNSLLHRSHTPYKALPDKDTVELLLWDTPIQGTLPFKRHKSWSQSRHVLILGKGTHFLGPKIQFYLSSRGHLSSLKVHGM